MEVLTSTTTGVPAVTSGSSVTTALTLSEEHDDLLALSGGGGGGTEPTAATNDTTVKKTDGSEYFYQVEQLTFLWILLSLIVIGNATVLIALMMSKGRKSRMNFFIKNLAVADLCVGLISVLTDIIWKITISWELGLIACKLIRFLQAVVTYASTYVLVALSIDRYDAITHPMNFSGSWWRARALVAAAWILSFIFSAPLLFFYETKEKKEYGTQCWIDFRHQWQWQLYMTLVSLALFVIPAILIAGCYIIIVCTIWNKGKDMTVPAGGGSHGAASVASGGQSQALLSRGNGGGGAMTVTTAGGQVINVKRKAANGDSVTLGSAAAAPANGAAVRTRSSDDEPESRRASSRGLIPKAKVKTVKMTFVIIFVFILCWGPYIGFDLLQVYGCIPYNQTNRAVATFIQSLAPLNSAANPIIYCLFSTNIGQQLCNLFGCSKKPASLSTGMTTSTHSTKPGNSSSVVSAASGVAARRTVSSTLSNSVIGTGNGNNNGIVKQQLSNSRSAATAQNKTGNGSSDDVKTNNQTRRLLDNGESSDDDACKVTKSVNGRGSFSRKSRNGNRGIHGDDVTTSTTKTVLLQQKKVGQASTAAADEIKIADNDVTEREDGRSNGFHLNDNSKKNGDGINNPHSCQSTLGMY